MILITRTFPLSLSRTYRIPSYRNPLISSGVLVTGASGYIASHVVHLLLTKGYKVRGTVRSLNNAAKVYCR